MSEDRKMNLDNLNVLLQRFSTYGTRTTSGTWQAHRWYAKKISLYKNIYVLYIINNQKKKKKLFGVYYVIFTLYILQI